MFAAGVQAADPDSLPAANSGGSTGAGFAGGVTINGGANYMGEIPAGQTIKLVGMITPDAADVGKSADIFVAAKVGSKFYQYNGTSFVAWAPDLGSGTLGLTASDTVTLSATTNVEIPDMATALGMSLEGAGLVKVYIAYAPTGESDLTYSSKGVKFTVDSPAADTCPEGTAAQNGFCVLSGTYTFDLHLTNNFDYIISGAVFIGGDNVNTAELTIDPGVTTYGESGNDFLVINRGSKIHVNGTPANPVTMTSANDAEATESTRGQWGGLILNGNAPINGCSEGTQLCEAEGEGSTGLYGGNDPEDSSGNLNYLVVKYAGYEITPENELNGIAFQGIGSGTLVDYVQVHNNSDDGMEFFGGRVQIKHVLLTGNADDNVDWVLGWEGKAQFVVVYQTDTGDQGIEADNLDTANDTLPRSRPDIANITMIGNANGDLGMLLREGTGAHIKNAVVTGFGDACVDIDNAATFINGGSSATDLTGELTITNSIVDCDTNFDEQVDDNWKVSDWYEGQDGNMVGGANMTGTYVNSSEVNAMTPATLTDPFFENVDYIGAVPSAEEDWTQGWTFRAFEDFTP